MVLQKLWVSQNFSRISRVSQSRFLAVMCVSQSRFFIRRCLRVSMFCKTKGISQKKSILTSPKLSEFNKKLEKVPQRHLAPEKKAVILFKNTITSLL